MSRTALFLASLAMVSGCDLELVTETGRPTLYGEVVSALSDAANPPRDVVLAKRGWARVRSPGELASALADGGERPVVVYAYAKWFLCGQQLETDALLDAEVQSKLEGYSLVMVDVTDPSADERAVQELLGRRCITVFADGSAAADAMRRDGALPEAASMTLDACDATLRAKFLALLE
ncbi:MAG: hypothetical protein AAGA54_34890 [Myxococcota bacterium]